MSGVQYSATMKHGPVSGPVNGVLGALALALLGRAWNKIWHAWGWWAEQFPQFPGYVPLVVALLGTVAAVLVGIRRGTDTKNIVFRCTCWLLAGAWTTYVIGAGFSFVMVGALAGGAVFAGLLAPGFGNYEPPKVEFQFQPGQVDFETELLEYIVQFCNLKPHERPKLRKVRDWARDAGVTYMVVGVRGSRFTWKKLRDIQSDIAAALQLDEGCPVEAESANTHQGAALLHISTKNFMKEPIDYPRDWSPLSIENEFSVGRFLDGSPTLIELKQAAGLAAGQRGGGKTVLLQNITASLVRCVDVIVWHVDLNGGGMAAPWTTPYALGEIDTPAVDWVATTPRQALKMAKVALRIAKDRKKSYQRLLIQNKTDVLPVGPDLPLIMIIVDESAEVTGETAVKEAQEVSKALQEVQRIGRAMCVNVFFSTQRATADYLPAQLKKGASVAFCTRVKDEAEFAHVFDWRKGLDPEMLKEPGQMYIQRGTNAVKMFQGYRLLPDLIIDCVMNTQQIRRAVRPDRRALAMGGTTYAQRWEDEDSVAFLASLRGDDDDDDLVAYDDDGEPVDAHDNDEVPDSGLVQLRSTLAALRANTIAAVQAEQAKRNQVDPAQLPPPIDPVPQQPAGRAAAPMVYEPPSDPAQFAAWLDGVPETQEPPQRPDRPPAAPQPGPQQAPPAGRPPTRPVRPIEPAFQAPFQAPPSGEDESGRTARRAFIVQFVQSAGANGRKTAQIVAAATSAGFTDREATVKEDLAALKHAGRLTQDRGGKNVFGYWFDQDYDLSQ